MMPQLPKRSQKSGNLKVMRDKGLRGVAIVASTFINLNKKKGFRKNFFISSGNSGNEGNVLYIGVRLNKKSRRRSPRSASVINDVNEVINAPT